WDAGTFVERSTPDRSAGIGRLLEGLAKGHITVVLTGRKIAGEFALIRIKDTDPKNWLMVKKRDEFAVYRDMTWGGPDDRSVATGRTMAEIAAQATGLGQVWLPGEGPTDPESLRRRLEEGLY